MAGYQLGPGEGFTDRLQAALEARGHAVTVANAGVSGDTSSDGLARLDWSVPDGTDLVILELGANDMLRGIDPAIIEKNLDAMIGRLKARGIAFRSLTEQMDTTTPHGELLFSLFGALAQYERALTRERVMAGLAAAKRRGRQGGRPPMIDAETLERITAALDGGASKASVCRTFKVPRSTLLGTLARIGWTAPAKV